VKRITIRRSAPQLRRPPTDGSVDSLVASYAIVTAAHSEDGTADVETDTGAYLSHVPVQSDSWVTTDPPTGTRNLPPVGATVIVLYPDGARYPDRSLIIRAMVPAVSTEHDGVVFEDGEENSEKSVNAAGWTATYDRETGDAHWESDSTDTNQIVIDVDRTNEKVSVSVGSIDMEVTPTTINLAGTTKQLVTHAELDTALQAFKDTIVASIASAITGHTHAGVTTGPGTSATGVGAATSAPAVDISAAASDNVRTG